MNKKFIYILSGILLFVIIIFIVILASKKKGTIIQVEPGTLEGMSDGQIKALANELYNWMEGITLTSRPDLLERALEMSDADFIRLYNAYYEIAGRSLYLDLEGEWFWYDDTTAYADALLNRMQRLGLN